MQAAVDRYDLDAATDAFLEQIKGGIPLGTFFKDRTGIRWKYVGYSPEHGQYIASHGEFGIVLTFTKKPDGTTRVETELKGLT